MKFLENKSKLFIIFTVAILFGCEKNSDDHIFTLYSSYKNNRVHIATFDATPVSWNDKKLDEQFIKWVSEDNFKNCQKVAKIFEIDWVKTAETDELKLWCEKGRYRN